MGQDLTEIHPSIVEYVAQHLDLPHEVIHRYDWDGSRIKEHNLPAERIMLHNSRPLSKCIFKKIANLALVSAA